jgi:formyl-CoA transferase
MKDRIREHSRVKEIVTAWTSQYKVEELVNTLLGVSLPCAPIYTIDQVVRDPHIAGAREMIVEMEHPLEGMMKTIGSVIKFSETPAGIRNTAPLLGQHTETIVKDLLGYTEEQYRTLEMSKAFTNKTKV